MEPVEQGPWNTLFLHESKHGTGPRIQMLNRSYLKAKNTTKQHKI